MQISKYLIISAKRRKYGGFSPSVRLCERDPKLLGNEIAVRIELDIPDALFKRPILDARMKIPNEAVPKTVITPQITDNLEKIIKEATGLNMAITVTEHSEERKD